MDPVVSEIVTKVLEFLEKTGTAIVTTGFPIAVKYVIADGISGLVKFVVASAGLATCVSQAIKLIPVSVEGSDNEQGIAAFKITVCVIIGIILLITAIFSEPFLSIQKIISPEWFAILNIIELVK